MQHHLHIYIAFSAGLDREGAAGKPYVWQQDSVAYATKAGETNLRCPKISATSSLLTSGYLIPW